MSIRRYKKISELDALTSASLDTYVAGVSNGTTVKIELDVLADGVLDRINALDIQRLNSLESFTSSYTNDSSSFNSRINDLIEGEVSLPIGVISSSQQITDFGFISESVDISSLNSFTSSYFTTSESIDSRLNSLESNTGSYETTGRGILSGSISYTSLTDVPEGIVSGSDQLTSSLNELYVISGSITQTTWDNIANKPNDIISSSAQISTYGFVSGSYETTGRNILSGSILELLPIGTITSSAQITAFGFISESVDISGLNSFTQSAEQRIGSLEAATSSYLTSLSGAISSSEQILGGSGILSGSVSYNDLTNIPTDIISSSAQITILGFVSGSYETTGRDILSGSILDLLPNGVVSGSEQVLGGSGVYSSSAQIEGFETTGREIISSSNQIAGLGYATTSSLNSFTASYITDSSSLDSRLDILEAYSSSQLVPTASVSNRTLQTDVYVKNSSGTQIDKGKVVRIVGAVGDNPLIVTASFLTEGQSANTLGITTENIANDSFGWVITEGVLLGVNTTGMNAGQLLFLGETGSFTTAFPVAPNHGVRLGEVLREQQNNGSIYVRIDNGSELGEAHDVVDTTTTSSYGDILMKSGSLWINNSTFSSSVDSRLDNQEAFSSSLSIIANSSTKILNRVSYTGGSSWEGTYSGNGGRVLVQATLTGFVSSVALYEAYLKRNGVTVDTTKLFFNATSQHTTFPTLYYVGENETGSNTYSVVVGAGVNLDANDFASIVVTETYNFLNQGLISSSAQIAALGYVTSSAAATIPEGTISSSAQITSFGFVSGSYETTGRNIISSSAQISELGYVTSGGNVTFNSVTANQYIVSSSVYYVTQSYSSGSTIFGNTTDDTHQFTGSVLISGSLTANLTNGYMWVGNGLNKSYEIPTASLVTTSSFNTLSSSVASLASSSAATDTQTSASIASLQSSLGATSNAFSYTAVTNPTAYVLVSYPTASYNGGVIDILLVNTVNSTATSAAYQFASFGANAGISQNGKQTSGAGAPSPTMAIAQTNGNIQIRVTETGTFNIKGVARLF